MLSPDSHILITGARGYIGGFLIQSLKRMGMKHIFCLTSSKDDPFLNDDPDISWIYCDVRERNMVFDIVRSISPEYVFHLAALGAKNSISTYSLETLFLINALGTQNLIDATMSVGSCKGFINVSTAYEYGPQNCSIHESTPFMPQGNYAISKIAGSLYLHEQIVKNHFPGLNIRLFSVYGPNDSDRIIPRIFNAFLMGEKITLFDIHRKRDFVYIDTVIGVLLGFDKIQKNNINSLNVGSGESITIHDLVFKISEILGQKIPDNIIFAESMIPTLHWQCDNALLKKYFPLPETLHDGLKKIIQN